MLEREQIYLCNLGVLVIRNKFTFRISELGKEFCYCKIFLS